MLTSVLVRERRPFELVVGRVDDPSAAGEVSMRCAERRRRRGSGARGSRAWELPQDGYACVDTPSELLTEKLGVEVVQHRTRAR